MSSASIRLLVAGVLVAIAGLCYSSWVLEFAWPDRLDPLNSFLSELDAAQRPHREVYVVGDVVTGVCTMIAAAVLLLPRRIVLGRLATTAVLAVGVFGAATVADALLPIECIPGIDAGCPYEPSGLLPQLHHVHALTSTIAVFAIFATMIAATLASLRSGRWPLLRVVGAVVFAVVALTTVWMMIADNLSGDYRLGLAQRIQVGGMTTWLVLWGWSVGRTDRVRPDDPTR
ncbi:DUF998 domain-containing protein [Gordonia soli]|uniref:DUF998 domain-containing protein n=1 Tax=Gordonia soli NBRC 108243 TaxID=1223545 RepID=M0QG19_9ACTN|nr:DUF998 domain-containing protein [Gordonia soli]GAC67570.1 hypothetical protein GS4_08_01550 [Gordonia soli NBRC 108243]